MKKREKVTPLQQAAVDIEDIHAAIRSYQEVFKDCEAEVQRCVRELGAAERDLEDTRSLLKAQMDKLYRQTRLVRDELEALQITEWPK